MSDVPKHDVLKGMKTSRESDAHSYSGYLMLLVLLALAALAAWGVPAAFPGDGATGGEKAMFVGSIVGALLALLFVASGFFMIQPNQAAVITLFGEYRGTERIEGLRWVWPASSTTIPATFRRSFSSSSSSRLTTSALPRSVTSSPSRSS